MKNQIVLLGLLALCTHSQMSAASPQKSIYHKGWIDFNKNGVMDIYERSQGSVGRPCAGFVESNDS